MSWKHCRMSTCFGVASISTVMQSRKMGTVVKMHRTAKIIVQIGSAMCASGYTKIMIEAITTPMLCTMSPMMWIIAARIFIFSWLCPAWLWPPPSP